MIQGIHRWWNWGVNLYLATNLSSVKPFDCPRCVRPSRANCRLKGNRQLSIPASINLFVSPSNQESDHFPNEDELSRQKAEVLESLSDYHDGTWICRDGALSFSISTDVAAGITAKRISVPYTTSVSLRMGASDIHETSNIRWIETFSWNTTTNPVSSSHREDSSSSSCCVAIRTVPCGNAVDVDSVDSSYSLDIFFPYSPSSFKPLLPDIISGQNESTHCIFLIEKVLALSDLERIRVFLLYHKDEYMMNPAQRSSTSEEEEVNCKLERVVLCQESRIDIDSTMSITEKPNDAIHILEPVSIFTLSLGPWLGDLVVRDQSSLSKDSMGFAKWRMGVQKVAMRFEYDFEDTVKNYIDYGRALGISAQANIPIFSKGFINENAMSRRIPPRERIMYIDYDSGSYAAFLMGSTYLKVRTV